MVHSDLAHLNDLLCSCLALFNLFIVSGINVLKKHIFDFDEILSELNRMLPKLLLNKCMVRLPFSRNIPKGKGLMLHSALNSSSHRRMKSCRKTLPLSAVKDCGTILQKSPELKCSECPKSPEQWQKKTSNSEILHPTPSYRVNTPRVGNGGPAICVLTHS